MVVKVENFQILRELVIEFAAGITLISGPNSSGKSSLFRAINAALRNPPVAKTFVTHGEKKSRVEVVFGEKTLIWTRSAKAATYEVNGQEYEKVGRSRVWDYDAEFPLGQDNDGKPLNFQGEWDLLFPFGLNGSQTYALLEEIFDLGDFRASFGKIKQDIQGSKAEAEAALVPLNHARQWLDDFDRLPAVVNIEALIAQAEKLDSTYRKLVVDHHALEKQVNAPVYTATIPAQWTGVDVLDASLVTLKKTLEIAERILPPKAKLVSDQFDRILETEKWIVELKKRPPEKLSFTPVSFDRILGIEGDLTLLRSLRAESEPLRKRRDQCLAELAAFTVCPLCGETEKTMDAQKVEQYKSLMTEVEKLNQRIDKAEARQTVAKEQVREKMDQLGVLDGPALKTKIAEQEILLDEEIGRLSKWIETTSTALDQIEAT